MQDCSGFFCFFVFWWWWWWWWFFFSFIIFCSFSLSFSPHLLRKEPYWNPRWQKACLPLLHLTHHGTHWTGLLFILYEVTDIYIFWLTPKNDLSTIPDLDRSEARCCSQERGNFLVVCGKSSVQIVTFFF
jgi:hypothetical protein